MAETVAALPRSKLHIELLKANRPNVDLVLFRDSHIADEIEREFPSRGVYLDRETRLPASPVGAVRTFAQNRRYYRTVRDKLHSLSIDRLLIFLEGEPLERMLADWFDGPIELWEDGLSHYVDLTHPAWYGARGAVQVLSGFYPRGALSRRADRTRMLVRDRFEKKNLALPSPTLAAPGPKVLYVGSPMVEDRLISRENLSKSLRRVAASTDREFAYLPHPREDIGALETMLSPIPRIELAQQPFGIVKHASVVGYKAFCSAVSTALLDLGAFDRSIFVPLQFGQRGMYAALSGWAANPVRTARSDADLKDFFGSLD